MGTLTTIDGPGKEPVTLAEVKDSLRVTCDDDDQAIIGLILAARMWAEAYLNQRIVSQVVEWSDCRFTSQEINLGIWPIIAIDSVKYDDTGSPITEQTLVEDTDYYTDIVTPGGRVKTISGWPGVAIKPNAVRIRVTAGYETVPEIIKEGIKTYIAALYDREPCLIESAESILCSVRTNHLQPD